MPSLSTVEHAIAAVDNGGDRKKKCVVNTKNNNDNDDDDDVDDKIVVDDQLLIADDDEDDTDACALLDDADVERACGTIDTPHDATSPAALADEVNYRLKDRTRVCFLSAPSFFEMNSCFLLEALLIGDDAHQELIDSLEREVATEAAVVDAERAELKARVAKLATCGML